MCNVDLRVGGLLVINLLHDGLVAEGALRLADGLYDRCVRYGNYWGP